MANNEHLLRFGSVVCRVNGVEIGGLKDAKFKVETESHQLVADNKKYSARKKVKSAELSCEMWEIDIARLQELDGMGKSVTLPSDQKTITGEILAKEGTVKAGTVFTLANVDAGTGTLPTATLKNGSQNMTTSDYMVTKNPDTNKTEVRIKKDIVVSGGATLTADYTYTSFKAVQYTVADFTQAIGTYPVEFINTNAEGKKFTIGLYAANQMNGIDWGFQADDKLDEVMSYPLSFQATPNGDKMLYYIIDEQGILA